jgi:hypothetical protein
MDEAVSAGNAVIERLGNVIESLRSAESWGTWDMLGGGENSKYSDKDSSKIRGVAGKDRCCHG